MKQILHVAQRELNSFFDSLTAYITIGLFLAISGLFTWIQGSNVFMMGQADLSVFFGVAYWTLFLLVPAISMKTLADENRTGTIELLLTRPVSEWQIVVGKFLSVVAIVAIALAFTLPFYITIANIGPSDHAAIITGYVGLVLMSAVYAAIGTMASSFTGNQIIAFLVSLTLGLFFHIVSMVVAQEATGMVGAVFQYLSMQSHFQSISRGVIDSRDLVYFGSLIIFPLIVAELKIMSRK